jgi:hypothetical protein
VCGKVTLSISSKEQCIQLKGKILGNTIENNGTIRGVGDIYVGSLKLKDLDVVLVNIREDSTIIAECFFAKFGMC